MFSKGSSKGFLSPQAYSLSHLRQGSMLQKAHEVAGNRVLVDRKHTLNEANEAGHPGWGAGNVVLYVVVVDDRCV